jgi:hypothetical protein
VISLLADLRAAPPEFLTIAGVTGGQQPSPPRYGG